MFYWERRSPSEGLEQGPSTDHTLGGEEGHFMTTIQTEGETNDKATLVSPKLPKLRSLCQLRFWYFVPDLENCKPSLGISLGVRVLVLIQSWEHIESKDVFFTEQ